MHLPASGAIGGGTLTPNGLPAMSANLLVVDGGDAIFANGFELSNARH